MYPEAPVNLSPAVVDAYLSRIGCAGPVSPTLATLNRIVFAHVTSVPFENLDVLLGRPIALDPEAVLAKLVHGRRGGYCFEQNGLLLGVLRSLGFDAQPISARVRLQRPREFTPPRTHMFVRLEIDGQSWLADVGIGALSLTGTLRLVPNEVQATPHEPRRLIEVDGRLFHQARLGEEWVDVCEFTLEAMPPIDREVANWYTSTHPGSHFRNRLIVARATPDGGRLTVLNRTFSTRGSDGIARDEDIPSPDALLELLAERFGLIFPPATRFVCTGLDWT
jgi:N-hydroxyarylamine O-acetyltransferase